MSVSHLARQRGKILPEMLRYHREQLPDLMRNVPLADLRAFATVAPPPLDFLSALKQRRFALIAGCQKASPVRGLLAAHYDPVYWAQTFAKVGAVAVAVWTESRYYQGQLDDLRDVKEALPHLPLLRPDLIFHPYQVYESRVAGADALILRPELVGDHDLVELYTLGQRLGLQLVLEVHTAADLTRALPLHPTMILLNRRNWQTFAIDETVVERLRPSIPANILVIATGGLATPEAVQQLRHQNVAALLLSESLSRHKTPPELLRDLQKPA